MVVKDGYYSNHYHPLSTITITIIIVTITNGELLNDYHKLPFIIILTTNDYS